MLSIKLTAIKIKRYQLKNILINLDHIQKTSQMIRKNLTQGKSN